MALLNLVVSESLEVVREAKPAAQPDYLFRRVELMPLDSIAVVRRKLMVKVMIALAERDDGRYQMISGRSSVVVGLVSEVVCQ